MITLTTIKFATIAGVCIFFAGCAELAPLSFPTRSSTAQAAETPTVQPQVSGGNISALLADVQELQSELKDLRNTVERQAYELDRIKNRQSDLYTDLDQRLRQFERSVGQTQLGQVSPPTIGTTTTLPTFANVDTNNAITAAGTTTQPAVVEVQAPTNQGTGQVTSNQSVNSAQTPGQVVSIGSNNQVSTEQVTQIGVVQPQVGVGAVSNSAVTLSVQDAYDEAFALLKRSLYADAIVAFEAFVRNYPANDLTDDAYYWMAEARYVTREFSPALAGFQTVTANFTGSQRVPASYLKIGYIQYETGAYAEARETLSFILKSFPTHRVSVSAETRLKKMDREGR